MKFCDIIKKVEKNNFADYGLAASLAVQSAVMIVASLFFGWFIDGWLETSPLFTIGLAVLGFIATLYSVYKRLMTT
ncbi:MAG: AtpZ/AtpI family protein [Negativicutes bacterium]